MVLSQQIKKYNLKELNDLNQKIKNTIIETVKNNGGHLSSNLASAESILALHYVFNFEKDKLLFDIGHQAYAHKYLTGRENVFNSLLKEDGMSSLIKESESKYDILESGHSGVSLSYLLALQETNKNNFNIVYTGDGAFCNGLNLSSLNFINLKNKKTIILINNNKMNITPSKGNIYNILNDSNKAKSFFNLFGFDFFYQREGNKLINLINDLENIKTTISKPTIYLIETNKVGFNNLKDQKGFYHKILLNNKNNFQEKINELLLKHKDEIRIIQSGMSISFKMQDFKTNYHDFQMNEEISVLFSSALSKFDNKKPVVILNATFMQRTIDQIINDCARLKRPVLFLINKIGYINLESKTHQGIYPFALLKSIPNIKIFTPLDLFDFENSFNYYLKTKNQTVFILYNEKEIFNISKNNNPLKWEIIKNGNGKIIISYSNLLKLNYDKLINSDNIIVNAKIFKPLDYQMLDYLFSLNKEIIILEENILQGSIYLDILDYKNKKGYLSKITSYHLKNIEENLKIRKKVLKDNNLI